MPLLKWFQTAKTESVIHFSRALAPDFVTYARNTAKCLSDTLTLSGIKLRVPMNALDTVETATFVFLLHVADRAAFMYGGPDKRAIFMDCLLTEVAVDCFLAQTGEFGEYYNAATGRYVQFKELFGKNPQGGLGGFLCWEFTKEIVAFGLTPCPPLTVVTVLQLVGDHAFALTKALNATSWDKLTVQENPRG